MLDAIRDVVRRHSHVDRIPADYAFCEIEQCVPFFVQIRVITAALAVRSGNLLNEQSFDVCALSNAISFEKPIKILSHEEFNFELFLKDMRQLGFDDQRINKLTAQAMYVFLRPNLPEQWRRYS